MNNLLIIAKRDESNDHSVQTLAQEIDQLRNTVLSSLLV